MLENTKKEPTYSAKIGLTAYETVCMFAISKVLFSKTRAQVAHLCHISSSGLLKMVSTVYF